MIEKGAGGRGALTFCACEHTSTKAQETRAQGYGQSKGRHSSPISNEHAPRSAHSVDSPASMQHASAQKRRAERTQRAHLQGRASIKDLARSSIFRCKNDLHLAQGRYPARRSRLGKQGAPRGACLEARRTSLLGRACVAY